MIKGSESFNWNGLDIKKILIHGAVYGLSMAATYILQAVMAADFGTYTPIIGLVLGGIVDAIRKYMQDNTKNG